MSKTSFPPILAGSGGAPFGVAAVSGVTAAVCGLLLAVSPIIAVAIGGSVFLLAASNYFSTSLLFLLLFARVLTDGWAAEGSRTQLAINPSGVIGALLLGLALARLLTSPTKRGYLGGGLLLMALVIWTGRALTVNGLDQAYLRELVRVASIVAVALITANSSKALTRSRAVRLLQLVGILPASFALYQFATGTGMNVAGDVRAYGTFSHPNSAVLVFAIITLVSLWSFLDHGRAKSQLVASVLFAAAALSTVSLGGLAALSLMLVAFAVFRDRRLDQRLALVVIVCGAVAAFVASPMGSQRLSDFADTRVGAASAGATQNSLEWRFYNWSLLVDQWRQYPLAGSGLGETVINVREGGELPHNEPLRLLVETGVLGGAAAAVGLFVLVRGLRKRSGGHQADRFNSMALALTCGLLVNSLASNTLLYTPAMYVAAGVIGLALRPQVSSTSQKEISRQSRKAKVASVGVTP